MLHWKPQSRRCDALDLAATWPWAGPLGGFPVSELAQSCCPDAAEPPLSRHGRNPVDKLELERKTRATRQEND